MIWVKVDVDLADHPRLVSCKDPDAALGLWLRGLSYTRKHMLDGFIPLGALRPFGNRARFEAVAAELVTAGLWVKCDGGWMIHNYVSKGNQTRDQVLAEAEKARQRTTAWRAKKADSPANSNSVTPYVRPPQQRSYAVGGSSSSYSSSYSDREMETASAEPVRVVEIPQPPEEPIRPPQLYQRSYEKGIEEGLGRPFALIEKHRAALHQALIKHAKGADGKCYRGDRLLAWIELQARAFAMQVPVAEQRFYSGLQPTGWLKWLNETPIQDADRDAPDPEDVPSPDRPSESDVEAARGQSETVRVAPQSLFALASGIGRGGVR